jgi:hypothetical protein
MRFYLGAHHPAWLASAGSLADAIRPLSGSTTRPAVSRDPPGSGRNLAVGILKLAGHQGIAAARRHSNPDAPRTPAILGISPA